MSAAVEAPVLALGIGAAPSGPCPAEASDPRLRVLGGPLDGAEVPVRSGQGVTIGRGFRNDVVLRDPSVGSTRLRIEPGADIARLTVLAGSVVLLGRRLGAGAEAVLPPYLPLAIGGSAIAIGGADPARWAQAAALVPHVTHTPANDAARPAAKGGVSWLKDIGIGALAFGALAACTAFFVPSTEDADPEVVAEAVRAALSDGGYREVRVDRDGPDGPLRLDGFVATDARRASLRAELDALEIDYKGQLRSGEAAARQVADVFSSGGVHGTARYAGGGAVVIEGLRTDAATAERLKARALADVPFVTDIQMKVTQALPEPKSAAFTGKIVQVVGGPDGYLTLADGTTYFVGATLPSGGVIVAIGDADVTIDEDGHEVVWTL